MINAVTGLLSHPLYDYKSQLWTIKKLWNKS